MTSGGAGEYNEDRHLLRSADCDEDGIGGGEVDLDVESQSPAVRTGAGGVRDIFKHLDRRFSLSGRRISFKRFENSRVDREKHHPSSASSSSAFSIGEEDNGGISNLRSVDDRNDEYGFDEEVLGDSAPPEWALLLIGCLIGVFAGICVAGFNKGVHVIHEWAWAGTPNEGAAWLRLQRLADTWHRILLIPVTGGVIVGMMHGLLEILDQIRQSTSSQGQGVDLLAGIFPVIKAIQAAVTLGTGCSLGPEGPSVDIGKSCANGFALMMENNRERRIALTAAGAASGIASGFNAAVAGCFFAIETVLRPLRAENSPPFTTAMIILASVISSTVSNALLGTQSAFTVPSYDLKSAAELPLYLILGMLCGAVSVVFSRLVAWFTKSFDFIKDKFGLPAIVCPALGGLGAGMIALKYPGILYWGFTNVEEILHTGKSASAPGIWLLAQLATAKVVATALCKGSGLVGGLYAPSLMIGAAVGAVFGGSAAEIINKAIPGNAAVAQPQAYALVGMAATLASMCSVPLTSVLLLFELTKDYRILLPLMGAVGLAIWVPSVVNQGRESDSSEGRNTGRGYSSLSPVERKTEGVWRHTDNVDSLELTVMENPDQKSFLDEETILEDIKVLRVMSKNYVEISLETTLREASNILKDSDQNCLMVVDNDDFLAGILTQGDIRRYLSNKVSTILDENTCLVSSVCTKKISYRGHERGLLTCYPDATVGVAKELMEARGVKQLPVVKRSEVIQKGKRRKLLGLLHYDSIWSFLRDEMNRRRSIHDRGKDKSEEIAIGAARGLAFLHHNCIPHIIHRDMKSSNVLLDVDFEARVSDLGIARLVSALDTHLSVSTLAGTPGYVPLEYYQSFRCTAKGDVYIYGVILLEVLSGKKPIDPKEFGEDNNLVGWAKQFYREKQSVEILDPELVAEKTGDTELFQYLNIASQCLYDRPFKRPTMVQVMAMFKELKADTEKDESVDEYSLTLVEESRDKEP